MKTICVFCGVTGKHKGDGKACQIKGAAMSALMTSMPRLEALLIADRTPFLNELVKNLKQIA